ncbi:MAG: CDP-alcohol phosphatidyltransferase family protein [Jannaschia sp.]
MPLTPSAQFLCMGGIFLLGAAALAIGLTGGVSMPGVPVAVGGFALAILLALRALRGYPHGSIGRCNVVTMGRLALVSGLVAALVSPGVGPWPIFGTAVVALALDGLDGWLARRDQLVSGFGAKFDMEVDALLALVLAVHAFSAGHVGPFILLLGVPRYLFWAAQLIWPWLSGDLPERFSRKVICVLQIGVLIAVLVPVLERPVTDVMAALAAGALLWSFGMDIRWLRQVRP